LQACEAAAQQWWAAEFRQSRLLARAFAAWLRGFLPAARAKRVERLQQAVAAELLRAGERARLTHAACAAWRLLAAEGAERRRGAEQLLRHAALRWLLAAWQSKAQASSGLKRVAVCAWREGVWLRQVRRVREEAATLLAGHTLLRRAWQAWAMATRCGAACRAAVQLRQRRLLSACCHVWMAWSARSARIRHCGLVLAAAVRGRKLAASLAAWRARARQWRTSRLRREAAQAVRVQR
jgi:hypothetical protein